MKLLDKLTRATSSVKLFAKDHSPEICMVLGTVELVGTVVSACKASVKFQDALKKHNDRLDTLDRVKEHQENGTATDEEASIDIDQTRKATYIDLAKEAIIDFGPTVLLGIGTVVTFGIAKGIVTKRLGIVTATAAKLMTENRTMEKNIIDEYGMEALYKLKGAKTETIVNTTVDEETGEVKTESVEYVSNDLSFCRWFDESHPDWTKYHGSNLKVIQEKLAWANHVLNIRGHLFFNDFLELMGFPDYMKTEEGTIYGWKKYKSDEEAKAHGAANYISAGLDDSNPGIRDFINGSNYNVLLRFNVDPKPIVGSIGFKREGEDMKAEFGLDRSIPCCS